MRRQSGAWIADVSGICAVVFSSCTRQCGAPVSNHSRFFTHWEENSASMLLRSSDCISLIVGGMTNIFIGRGVRVSERIAPSNAEMF